MIVTDLSNSFNPVPKIKNVKSQRESKEKYEKVKEIKQKNEQLTKRNNRQIKGKKHKQTKEKEIPMKVKKVVWERDKHQCIFCHKRVEVFYANAHFIPRSQGGLGIEQNIFTACEDCHREQDNGKNTEFYNKKAERHLRRIYGANWDKSKLVYKK